MMLMKFPNKANLERLRRVYPKGTKVRLLAMDDPQAPPVGTKGEVRGVDDAGNILVSWENGSSLSLILGTDKFERIPGEMIYDQDSEGIRKRFSELAHK